MRARLDPARIAGVDQPSRSPTGRVGAGLALVWRAARAIGRGLVGLIGGLVLMVTLLAIVGALLVWLVPGGDSGFSGTSSVNDTWDGSSCASSPLPVMRAAAGGDAAAVREQVDGPQDANVTDDDGRTPLGCAAAGGDLATVRTLLELGADPGSTTEDGDTALVAALVHCNVSLVAPLIAGGADPEAPGSYPVRPMRLAIDLGLRGAVQDLLAAGVPVDDLTGPVSGRAEGRCGAAAPEVIAGRQADSLALVLDAGADPAWVLQQAAMLGEAKLAEAALAAGATVDDGALIVRGDEFERLCRLQLPTARDRGCSVAHSLAHRSAGTSLAQGTYPLPPLLEASGRGHHEVMVLLLRAGADPEASGPANVQAMDAAVERDDPVAIELLRGALVEP